MIGEWSVRGAVWWWQPKRSSPRASGSRPAGFSLCPSRHTPRLRGQWRCPLMDSEGARVGARLGGRELHPRCPLPDTPATTGRASPPPRPCSRADVSPVLSAAERLSGVCIIYLLGNIYWDLVFNNCHSNISFLNPFRSAAVAILNIYQQCSCVHWLGCKFFRN